MNEIKEHPHSFYYIQFFHISLGEIFPFLTVVIIINMFIKVFTHTILQKLITISTTSKFCISHYKLHPLYSTIFFMRIHIYNDLCLHILVF
jgi:hypothetical protein